MIVFPHLRVEHRGDLIFIVVTATDGAVVNTDLAVVAIDPTELLDVLPARIERAVAQAKARAAQGLATAPRTFVLDEPPPDVAEPPGGPGNEPPHPSDPPTAHIGRGGKVPELPESTKNLLKSIKALGIALRSAGAATTSFAYQDDHGVVLADAVLIAEIRARRAQAIAMLDAQHVSSPGSGGRWDLVLDSQLCALLKKPVPS